MEPTPARLGNMKKFDGLEFLAIQELKQGEYRNTTSQLPLSSSTPYLTFGNFKPNGQMPESKLKLKLTVGTAEKIKCESGPYLAFGKFKAEARVPKLNVEEIKTDDEAPVNIAPLPSTPDVEGMAFADQNEIPHLQSEIDPCPYLASGKFKVEGRVPKQEAEKVEYSDQDAEMAFDDSDTAPPTGVNDIDIAEQNADTGPLQEIASEVEGDRDNRNDANTIIVQDIQSADSDAHHNETTHVDIADVMEKRPTKRPRLLLDAVEVQPISAIYGGRVRYAPGQDAASLEALNKKMEKLENPKVKKLKGFDLSLDAVRDRLLPIGLHLHHIPLDKDTLDATVSRFFMAAHYGGNVQVTRPKIREELLAIHGLNDFMYPNLELHPRGPQLPGAPGLFFGATGKPAHEWIGGVQRVIVRIKPGVWQYLGQYSLKPAPSLTRDEWAAQGQVAHKAWAKQIHKKAWGKTIRVRVWLRRTYGEDFKRKRFKAAMKDQRDYKNVVTEDEIRHALLSGQENMSVWTMKCVGYEIDFQCNLANKFPNWVPPPPKSKRGIAERERNRVVKTEQPLGGNKRKRVADVVTAFEEPEDEDSREEDELGENEIEELVYKPRGTRSRPIRVK